jgi:hypothetical protein
MTGAHRSQTCAQCHGNQGFQGLNTSCAGCHSDSDPHHGSLGRNCQDCHTTTRWDELTFDHGRSSLPLSGAHGPLSCDACHADGAYAGTPSSCSSCHSDPAFHQGSFTEPCETCHNVDAWRPADFPRDHLFPLDHEGEDPDCGTCHPASVTTYSCEACHAEGEMVQVHAEEEVPDLSRCTDCHP